MEMNMEKFEENLKCTICSDKFEDPKILMCGHQYCKACLEDRLVFNTDGSAILTCPVGCAKETSIGDKETINDLTTPLNFVGILEASSVAGEEPQTSSCCYVENCEGKASVYCCDVLMCEMCSINYVNQEKKKVSFNKKEKKLKVICEKHGSPCNDLCCDDIFLCTYCLNRDNAHERHGKNLIGRDVKKSKEIKKELFTDEEPICQFKKATMESIAASLEKMDALLQERRNECLAHYEEFLKCKEDMLKRKFKRICDVHLEQYPQVCPKLEKDVKTKTHLKCTTVSLSEGFHFQSENPLGDFQVINDDVISVNSSPVSTLRDTMTLRNNSNVRINTTKEVMVDFLSESVQDTNSLASYGDIEKSFQVLSHEQASPLPLKVEMPVQTEFTQNLVDGGSQAATEMSTDVGPAQDQVVDITGDYTIVKNPNYMKQAYFDITIAGEPSGRVIFDLYNTIVPRTCKNFIQLCTHKKGFGYRASKFFDVMPETCCVGGDVINNDGSGGESVYGPNFPCENFKVKHDAKGVLSMFKNGQGGNDSRFIIYTKAMPERNGDIVAFGKVSDETYPIIEKIMSVRCVNVRVKKTMFKSPCKIVVIANCGVL